MPRIGASPLAEVHNGAHRFDCDLFTRRVSFCGPTKSFDKQSGSSQDMEALVRDIPLYSWRICAKSACAVFLEHHERGEFSFSNETSPNIRGIALINVKSGCKLKELRPSISDDLN